MPEITLIDLPYQTSLLPLFQTVRDLPYPAMLDSNHDYFPDTKYDILVADPLARIHPKKNNALIQWRDTPLYDLKETGSDNPMTLLNELYSLITQEPWANIAHNALPFTGGLLGFYGYDSGHFVEDLPDTVNHDISLSRLHMGLYGWAVITSHEIKKTQLVITPWCTQEEANQILARLQPTTPNTKHTSTEPNFALTSRFSSNMSEASYATKFKQVQDYIRSGDCYQVNLAQRFSSTYQGDTLKAYQRLRRACPTPFSAYLELESGQALLSHSPERFLLCDNGRIETKPIKGTIARGVTPQADQNNADTLLKSEKDRAENLMIVDLLRNDLGRTCVTGSIKVPSLFALESYANVHHLVSTIEGRIEKREQAIRVFHESFPGGSITGAPKIRAMEIIDELEPDERSAYCGSIVYFSTNGQMDSSITIRTLVADQGKLHCWAGGGLVADSTCQDEYQETFTKVGKLTHTLEQDFLK